MCMEVKAITEMIEWIKDQPYTRAICLTDSQSTLAKIDTGRLYADWLKAISESSLQKSVQGMLESMVMREQTRLPVKQISQAL